MSTMTESKCVQDVPFKFDEARNNCSEDARGIGWRITTMISDATHRMAVEAIGKDILISPKLNKQ